MAFSWTDNRLKGNRRFRWKSSDRDMALKLKQSEGAHTQGSDRQGRIAVHRTFDRRLANEYRSFFFVTRHKLPTCHGLAHARLALLFLILSVPLFARRTPLVSACLLVAFLWSPLRHSFIFLVLPVRRSRCALLHARLISSKERQERARTASSASCYQGRVARR